MAKVTLEHIWKRYGDVVAVHDVTFEALTMGDRIAVMKDGFLQQIDKPGVLYDYPTNTFVAGFIGSPAMNLVPGELQQTDGKLNFESGGLSVPLPDTLASAARQQNSQKVLLGIRPEHIDPVQLAQGTPP